MEVADPDYSEGHIFNITLTVKSSVAEPEPRFSAWSRSWFKIWAGAGAKVFGSAPAPFFGSEKHNNLKIIIFLCIPTVRYIFLYDKLYRYLLTLPTVKYKTRQIFWDWVNLLFPIFPVFGTKSRLLELLFIKSFSNVLYQNLIFGAERL